MPIFKPSLIFLSLLSLSSTQPTCMNQVLPSADHATMSLKLRNGVHLNSKISPSSSQIFSRSIVRCRSTVEVLSVPERASAYEGVKLGAIVTIVETDTPLTNATEIERQARPTCSGIFVTKTHIMSSAHCVYHQRQNRNDSQYWMYGTKREVREQGQEVQRYLYAIAGKVSEGDQSFTVYPLQRGCIPQSYVEAENEATTSGQNEDLVIFSSMVPFSGDSSAIATFTSRVSIDEPKEYLLGQYPSDVENGEQMVLDINLAGIKVSGFMGGVFHSVELASWSGSSGGPIIDVEESNRGGRPMVVGVLMSSGLGVCDSGIVTVTKEKKIVEELIQAASIVEREEGNVEETENEGEVGGSMQSMEDDGRDAGVGVEVGTEATETKVVVSVE